LGINSFCLVHQSDTSSVNLKGRKEKQKQKQKTPKKGEKKKLLESSLKLNIDCNHSLIRFIFDNAKERGAC
jgi:hypothetical protein